MGFEAAVANMERHDDEAPDYVWIEFPATSAEIDHALGSVGIVDPDAFGFPYDEVLITDYSCDGYSVGRVLGEFTSLERLNAAAELIDELNNLDAEGLREYCDEHHIEVSGFDDVYPVDDDAILELIQEKLADEGLPGLLRSLAPCVAAGSCENVYIDDDDRLVPIETTSRTLGELRNQVFVSAMVYA